MIDGNIPAIAPVGSAPAVLRVDTDRQTTTAPGTPADFAAMLGQVAVDAAGAVKNAETLSIAGVRGQASVQKVVEAVMSAEQTLQSAIAIRDKAVSAYLELSRMSI